MYIIIRIENNHFALENTIIAYLSSLIAYFSYLAFLYPSVITSFRYLHPSVLVATDFQDAHLLQTGMRQEVGNGSRGEIGNDGWGSKDDEGQDVVGEQEVRKRGK